MEILAWLILAAGFAAGIGLACAIGRPAHSKWRTTFVTALLTGMVLGSVHTFLDFRGTETLVLVPLSIAGALKVTFGFVPGAVIGGLCMLIRYAFNEDVDPMRRIRAALILVLAVSLVFSLGVFLGWPYSPHEKASMIVAVFAAAVGVLVTTHYVDHNDDS